MNILPSRATTVFLCVVLVALARVACAADLFVIGFESAIGLLLLSVDSATSLAEERARGSLDVLMTTPLSTRSIVWAKWRGAYRRVLSLAVLPAIVDSARCAIATCGCIVDRPNPARRLVA